jgi:hypothetical protein
MTTMASPAIPIVGNPVRMTFFMTTPSRTISESHWYATDGADPVTVLNAGVNLAQYRVNLLASGASMVEVRVSIENIYRDSLVDSTVAFLTPAGITAENLGNDAIVIRAESTSLYRKVFYLGGIPDGVIVAGKYDPAAAGAGTFGKDVVSYLKALQGKQGTTQGSWGFLALDKSAACPRCNVTSINVTTAPTVVTVTCKQAHNCSNGDLIRLSYVPNATAQLPWNQVWAVTVVNPTTVTLNGFPIQLVGYSQGIGGFLTKQQRILRPYTNLIIDSVNTRKRGARAFLPRGRSKKKHTVGY